LEIRKRTVLYWGKQVQKYPFNNAVREKFFYHKKYYKKLYKKSHREFSNKMLDQIQNLENHNPQKFWSLINNLREQKQEGQIDPKIWYEYFEDLSKDSSSSLPKYNENFKSVINKKLSTLITNNKYQYILDKEFTDAEIIAYVKTIKNKKTCGIDIILNEMIKSCIVMLVSLFTKLFNFILKYEYFPKDWCKGFIIPIFKSGDEMNPSNYRGITISSCFGKVFTGIMNQRLVTFASSQNIFVDEQIGFMKNCRTADHIFVLKTLLDICKTKKDSLFCCFIDFRKAFDTVWRNGLFYKLLADNVSSKFVHVLQSMYSQLQSCVRTNDGYCSNFFNSQVGTRQGCNLSPTVFNLYLNDFPKLLMGCDPVKMG
jgi:hypothetical protein